MAKARVMHKATNVKKDSVTGWLTYDKIICGIKHANNWSFGWRPVTCKRCLKMRKAV